MNELADGGGVQIKVGGKDCTLTPTTLGDMQSLGARLKGDRLKAIKEAKEKLKELQAIDDSIESDEVKKAINEYMKPITDTDVFQYMNTIDGGTYVIYLAVSRNSDLSYDEFVDSISTNEMTEIKESRKEKGEQDSKNAEGEKD